MSDGNPYLYGGWVVVDVRLGVFVLALALLLTAGTLALMIRREQWEHHVLAGIGMYVGLVATLFAVVQWALDRPIVRVESFFRLFP